MMRYGLSKLTGAETEALRHAVLAGHVLPTQAAQHLEKKGFGAVDVLSSIKSKTTFLGR